MIKFNSAEGGSHGVAVTTGNSGGASGNAWGAIEDAGSVLFSTAAAKNGTLGHLLPYGTAGYKRLAWSDLSSTSVAFGMWVRFASTPAGDSTFGVIYNGSSLAGVAIQSTGIVAATQGSSVLNAAKSASALSINTWYYVTLGLLNAGASSTAAFKVYNADGSVFHTWSGTITTANSTAATMVRFGRIASSVDFGGDVHLDDLTVEYQSAALDFPAAPITGTPANSGPLWKIDASGLTGGAGALTHSISPTTGVVETSEGVFWVPQGSSAVTYTVTSTDGATPVTNDVTVPAAGVDGIRRRRWDGSAFV